MKRLDLNALKQGAMVALVFAIPFAALSRWLYDRHDHSPWVVPAALAALVGFTLGAGVAAWVQTERLPLIHGLVCAGGSFLVAEAVFAVVKIARGGHVDVLGAMFTFTSVLFAGLVGGGLGSVLQKQGIAPRGKGRP